MGHTGLWKSPRILESCSLGLGLDRTEQTRGGSLGLWCCLSVAQPAKALVFPSGNKLIVPSPSTWLPSPHRQLGLPLAPCLDSGWCDWAGVRHPFEEGYSQHSQCPALAGLGLGSPLTPALAIRAGGSKVSTFPSSGHVGTRTCYPEDLGMGGGKRWTVGPGKPN